MCELVQRATSQLRGTSPPHQVVDVADSQVLAAVVHQSRTSDHRVAVRASSTVHLQRVLVGVPAARSSAERRQARRARRQSSVGRRRTCRGRREWTRTALRRRVRATKDADAVTDSAEELQSAAAASYRRRVTFQDSSASWHRLEYSTGRERLSCCPLAS